ncbi:hypothetical protein [Crenobacter cavernae]|uniref:Uncharacterized protein n=1 Tax=Crenobacter cavernae TaxID=2290923 RepID=A0ABY0FB39_9NEIS|nr:hypothetical protein [Crenobacter cavernae]RXZ43107.1 hypothetical protein EBB06_10825 [Crenobacter cavernae]
MKRALLALCLLGGATLAEAAVERCYYLRDRHQSVAARLVLEHGRMAGKLAFLPHEKDGMRGRIKPAPLAQGGRATVRYDYLIEGQRQRRDLIVRVKPASFAYLDGEWREVPGSVYHERLKNPASARWSAPVPAVSCRLPALRRALEY